MDLKKTWRGSVVPAGIVLVLAAGLLVAACSDDATSTPPTTATATTTTTPPSGTATTTSSATGTATPPISTGTESPDTNVLSLTMKEFSITTDQPSVKAGKVTVSAANQGAIVHEFVILKTDLAPTGLPRAADGTVDEEQLESPGEIEDIGPGTTGKGEFTLTPGNYVLICNLPGHYAAGMTTALTVQ